MPGQFLGSEDLAQLAFSLDFQKKVDYAREDLLRAGPAGVARGLGAPQLAGAIDPFEMGAQVRSVGAQVGETLAGVAGRAIPNFARPTLRGLSTPFGTALAGYGGREIADLLSQDPDEAHRWSQAYEQAAREITGGSGVGSVGRSIATSLLPQAAVAKTPLGVFGSIALAGATTASQSVQEAREAGAAPGGQAAYAAKQTTAELGPTLAFQALNRLVPGLGGVESALAGKATGGLAKRAIQTGVGMAGEAAEEGITEAFQAPASAKLHGQELSREDYLKQIGFASAVGAGAGGVANVPSLAQGYSRDVQAAGLRKRAPQDRGIDDIGATLAAQQALERATEPQDRAKLATLAQNPSPSRSDWRASGMPLTGEAQSGGWRAAFASALAHQLSAADSPAGFEITSPTQPAQGPTEDLERVDRPAAVTPLTDAQGTLGAYERGLRKKYGDDFLTKASEDEQDRLGFLQERVASLTPQPTPQATLAAPTPEETAPVPEQAPPAPVVDEAEYERRKADMRQKLEALSSESRHALAKQYNPNIRGWHKKSQIDLILKNQEEELRRASTIRSDAGQVQEAGPVDGRGPREGSEDIRVPEAGEREAVSQPPQAEEEIQGPEVARPIGRRPISRESVAKVFPQSRIIPTREGYRVEVGGSFFDIEFPTSITVTPEALSARLGRQATPEEVQNFVARGVFSLRTADGTRHDGLGIIRMAQDLAGDDTLRHEALHLARSAGFLTPNEWSALAAKYGQPGMHDAAIEEAVAKSKETWTENRSLWQRIQSWLRRLLATFGYDRRTSDDIYKMMTEAGFWQRKAKPLDKQGEVYSEAEKPQVGPIFFSKLLDVAKSSKVGRVFTKDQLLSTLRNAGVKEEELVDTRVAELFYAKPKATKEDLIEWLGQNAVKVEEKVRGAPVSDKELDSDETEAEARALAIDNRRAEIAAIPPAKLTQEILNEDNRLIEEQASLLDLMDRLRIDRVELAGGGAKYNLPDLVLPGAKPGSYRELLLTLPVSEKPPVLQWDNFGPGIDDQRTKGKHTYRVTRGTGFRKFVLSVDGVEQESYQTRQLARQAAEEIDRREYGEQKPEFRSTHWNEPNVLAHVRFNDRTDADGKRVLFLEEIQSDFAQAYRTAKASAEHLVKSNFESIVENMEKQGVLKRVKCQ